MNTAFPVHRTQIQASIMRLTNLQTSPLKKQTGHTIIKLQTISNYKGSERVIKRLLYDPSIILITSLFSVSEDVDDG